MFRKPCVLKRGNYFYASEYVGMIWFSMDKKFLSKNFCDNYFYLVEFYNALIIVSRSPSL